MQTNVRGRNTGYDRGDSDTVSCLFVHTLTRSLASARRHWRLHTVHSRASPYQEIDCRRPDPKITFPCLRRVSATRISSCGKPAASSGLWGSVWLTKRPPRKEKNRKPKKRNDQGQKKGRVRETRGTRTPNTKPCRRLQIARLFVGNSYSYSHSPFLILITSVSSFFVFRLFFAFAVSRFALRFDFHFDFDSISSFSFRLGGSPLLSSLSTFLFCCPPTLMALP